MVATRNPSPPIIDDSSTLVEVLKFLARDGVSENADPTRSSSLRHSRVIFEKGDLVWAKAFPFPWCPALVVETNGPMALVSPFGWDTTRWYKTSRLHKFEENYVPIIKVLGAKLADEIQLALEELRRKTLSSLRCSCFSYSTEANVLSGHQIQKVKKGFKPRKMLDFVLDIAVYAWVGDEENVTAVRVLAQVNAFRRYVSACEDIKANTDVSLSIDVEKTTGVAIEVDQPDACQGAMGLRVNSPSDGSEGSDQEASVSSLENGMVYGVIKPQDDFSIDILEEGGEIFRRTAQEGNFTCTINSMDFSIFDSDEDYVYIEKQNLSSGSSSKSHTETACYKNSSHADDGSENAGSGTELHVTETAVGSLFSHDANQTQENVANYRENYHIVQSVKDVAFGDVSIRKENSSHGDDSRESAGNGTELHATEISVDSLSNYDINHTTKKIADHWETGHIVQSEEDVDFGDISIKRENSSHADDGSENTVSWTELLVSETYVASLSSYDANNTPGDIENHGVGDHIVQSEKNKAFADVSIKKESSSHADDSTENAGNVTEFHATEISLDFSSNYDANHTPQTLANSWESGHIIESEQVGNLTVEKENFSHTDDSHDNAGNGTELHATEISVDSLSSYDANHTPEGTANCWESDHIVLSEKDVAFGDILNICLETKMANLRDEVNTATGEHEVISPLALRRHVYKSTSPWKKGLDHSVPSGTSKWCTLYASPLVKDSPNSINKARKSLVADKSSSLPKSLHMKFPKDFKLPSKDELEKKFTVFGPLDCSRTKIFFYTGSGKVVFLKQADAITAYKHTKKKNIFGQVNVHFWFDEYEKYRKVLGRDSFPNCKSCPKELSPPVVEHIPFNFKSCNRDLSVPEVRQSTSNSKSCLKRPNILLEQDVKKKRKVRFIVETQ